MPVAAFTDLPASVTINNPGGSAVVISRVGVVPAGATIVVPLNSKLESKRLAIWKALKSAKLAGVITFTAGATDYTGFVRYANASGVALNIAGYAVEIGGEFDVQYDAMNSSERSRVFKMVSRAVADGRLTVVNAALEQPSGIAILPNTGSIAGGLAVTITGANFNPGATVTIGGVAATSIKFVNDNTITAVTPATTAGAKNVVVTNTNALAGTLVGGFTYA